MSKTKISVLVDVKTPQTKDVYKKPRLYDKVQEYIRRVDAPEIESCYEWNYLKRFYERLVSLPEKACESVMTRSEIARVLDQLEDLFEKYAKKTTMEQFSWTPKL